MSQTHGKLGRNGTSELLDDLAVLVGLEGRHGLDALGLGDLLLMLALRPQRILKRRRQLDHKACNVQAPLVQDLLHHTDFNAAWPLVEMASMLHRVGPMPASTQTPHTPTRTQ